MQTPQAGQGSSLEVARASRSRRGGRRRSNRPVDEAGAAVKGDNDDPSDTDGPAAKRRKPSEESDLPSVSEEVDLPAPAVRADNFTDALEMLQGGGGVFSQPGYFRGGGAPRHQCSHSGGLGDHRKLWQDAAVGAQPASGGLGKEDEQGGHVHPELLT